MVTTLNLIHEFNASLRGRTDSFLPLTSSICTVLCVLIASSMAKVASVTSISSANGIGASFPSFMAAAVNATSRRAFPSCRCGKGRES
jgi:hypothetical protein